MPVILTGQGGDEILSGYWQSYFMYLRELGLRGRMLTLAAHLAGALLPDGNPSLLGQVPVMLRRYLARRRGLAFLGGTANRRQRSAAARAGKSGASPKSERDSDDVPAETA